MSYEIKLMEVFSNVVLLCSYVLNFLLLQNLNVSNFYSTLLFYDKIFLIYGIVIVMVLYLIIHELLIAHEMLKICMFYIWVNGMGSYGCVCHIACTGL